MIFKRKTQHPAFRSAVGMHRLTRVHVKKEFILKRADRRIKRFRLVFRLIILVMSLVVLYDSFKHELPFYYILFLLLGVVVGRIYNYTHRVEFDQESLEVSLNTNRWSLVLLILVIVIRFVLGKRFLESINVFWAGDALYLFFIGVYHSRLKGIVRQIDEIYYGLMQKRHG